VVCISQPAHFRALGYHYMDFRQLADDEVTAALQEAAQRRSAGQSSGRNKAPR
jgi:putative phosphoribosyl transferase